MKIIILVTTAFFAVLSTAGFIAVFSTIGFLTVLSAAGAADLPRKEVPPTVAAPIGWAAQLYLSPHVATYPPGRVHRAVPPNQN